MVNNQFILGCFRIFLYHYVYIDRFAEAKRLAEKLNEVRNKISEYILASFHFTVDEITAFKGYGMRFQFPTEKSECFIKISNKVNYIAGDNSNNFMYQFSLFQIP